MNKTIPMAEVVFGLRILGLRLWVKVVNKAVLLKIIHIRKLILMRITKTFRAAESQNTRRRVTLKFQIPFVNRFNSFITFGKNTSQNKVFSLAVILLNETTLAPAFTDNDIPRHRLI